MSRLLLHTAVVLAPLLVGACGEVERTENLGFGEGGDAQPAPRNIRDTTEPWDPNNPEACPSESLPRTCGDDDASIQFCSPDPYTGERAWGPCWEDIVCMPGQSISCDDGIGQLYCELYDGTPQVEGYCNPVNDTFTPLVIVPRGHSVEYTPAGTMAFDTFSGQCLQHDWPTAQTPWLALDRDRSGFIEDGRELFGSGTFLASGDRAANGFEALAEFDANHDGVIDRKDPVFSQLVLWADENGDRRSSPGELTSLKDAQIRRLPVKFEKDLRCDGRGNCEFERASAGRNHTIVDIHLACR